MLSTVNELDEVYDFVSNHTEIKVLDRSSNYFRPECWTQVLKLLRLRSLQVLNMEGNSVVAFEDKSQPSRFVDLLKESPLLLTKLIWIPECLVSTGLWNSALRPDYNCHEGLIQAIKDQHLRFFSWQQTSQQLQKFQ
jgi:hypothetical protein